MQHEREQSDNTHLCVPQYKVSEPALAVTMPEAWCAAQ